MNLSHAYVDYVMARLSAVAEVSYRRIFNGVGIYFDGVQFALIVNNKLYLRADEQSRHLFVQRKMPAFQPRAAKQVESSFFQLPDEALGAPAELRYWLRIALQAATLGQGQIDEPRVAAPIHHLRQRA